MLRITKSKDTPKGITLHLEGRLVGRWVEILEEIREQQREGPLALTLDLADVSFASRAGALLLCRMSSEGVALRNWPPFLRAVCSESPSEDRPDGSAL